ncbi:hypothetical protein ES332_D12G303300v1 [Gossypium tomentosum]|uniref:Uncharacterized protein n=1 Tax=Gossypium tomentosum TaxID=34277 RepID=A0A5D2IFZ9_GOSTO|nr:hypothetical protein ES332_D12G303300v1 [Gossypium tomentosum]
MIKLHFPTQKTNLLPPFSPFHPFKPFLFTITMRTKENTLVMFLVFLIILGLMGVTSCRHIKQETSSNRELIDQRLRDRYSPMFLRSFTVIHGRGPKGKPKTSSSVHVVSHRLVPGGPNPLHN